MHGIEVLAGLGVLIYLGDVLEPHAFFHFFHDSNVLLYFAACAEVLDEQVHQQHGTVGYENEDRCERAGEAVRALLGEFVDLNGDEQELRRDEQDYRGARTR